MGTARPAASSRPHYEPRDFPSNDIMEHTTTSFPIAFRGLGVFVFTLVLTLAAPPLFAQASDRPSDVLGLAFVGHQVSDVERSIKFFEALDFQVIQGPGGWTV